MHKTGFTLITASILVLALCCCTAAAYSTPESITAAGKVYISNVSYNPGAFFSGDTGTVTYVVANGNTDQGVVVNHATFNEANNKFRLVAGAYQDVGLLLLDDRSPPSSVVQAYVRLSPSGSWAKQVS